MYFIHESSFYNMPFIHKSSIYVLKGVSYETPHPEDNPYVRLSIFPFSPLNGDGDLVSYGGIGNGG